MKKTVCIFLSLVMIIGLSACDRDPGEPASTVSAPVSDPAPIPVPAKEDGTDTTENGFDEAFIAYTENCLGGNYMVSPLSFRYALGLLLAGADGNTKTELLKAMKVESVDEWTAYCREFNAFADAFDQQLQSDIKRHKDMVKKGYVDGTAAQPVRALRVANSVWKRADIKTDFTASYKKTVSTDYGAEYFDFTENNAVKKINDWVNEKTEKMIPRLLPDNYPVGNLAVVLMNALYYKNSWENPFNHAATKTDDFHAKDGKTVRKSFMEQTENLLYYADGETQMVVLPMKGGVKMAFVLGDTADIAKKISKSEYRRVTVRIPKMDIETSLDQKELVGFLSQNGVSDAFDAQRADFSAMIAHPIRVDDIVQKTRIKTDEDGVEAAAVTAIMAKDLACPVEADPIEFVADRPFSFYIYADCDDMTATLFAGKMVE